MKYQNESGGTIYPVPAGIFAHYNLCTRQVAVTLLMTLNKTADIGTNRTHYFLRERAPTIY